MKVVRYGVEIDLSREGKVACPKCRLSGHDNSGDNLHVYGIGKDGKHKGAKCFRECGMYIPTQEQMDENKFRDGGYERVGREFNAEINEEIKSNTFTFGLGADGKPYRGVPEAITKPFGVRYSVTEDNEVLETYYPVTQDFELSGYKVRSHPKDFASPGPYGETGRDCDLFMQFKFKNAMGKYVLITSGEHDALAAYYMLYSRPNKDTDYPEIPVVSGTTGEGSLHIQLQNQYAWLDRFEKIIICIDPDDTGKKCLERVSQVVPRGKLHVMPFMTEKDPNAMLEKGKMREFVSSFYQAKPYTPEGIVGSSELEEKMLEAIIAPRIPFPPFYEDMNELTAGGIPLKKIVNIGSMSGAGKSTIVDEFVYFWIFNAPYRVGILSLESDGGEYNTKLLSRHVGRKIELIRDAQERYDFVTSPDVKARNWELLHTPEGDNRFYLIEERDGSFADIKRQVERLVIECECQVVILDPLQDVLDGMSNEDQSLFMKWQKGMVKSHDMSFININHVRKSGGGQQANSTGAELFEEDFQGSSAIFKSGALNILMMRNKEAVSIIERNTTRSKVTKCRWTGRTSPNVCETFYDIDTHTLIDLKDYRKIRPDLFLPDGSPKDKPNEDGTKSGPVNTGTATF